MAVLDAVKRGRQREAAVETPADALRVLVMSHAHPKLSRGGAEISAGALFRGLAAQPGTRAWFLGCGAQAGSARLGVNLSQPFGAADFVYAPSTAFDHFKFASRDAQFPRMLEELVAELQPNIVHAHHYTVFGVEAFSIIKRAAPSCHIVLTLHEYLAICHNHGQMVKTSGDRLCHAASPIDCAACFPELAPRDFFLRQLYLQKFLRDVDLFVSPSRFLAERYVAWGLPAGRMRVVENMPPQDRPAAQHPPPGAAEPASRSDGREVHVGFFGQMSPLKGIEILIEAASLLDKAGVANVVIDVYGDYSNQPAAFQHRVTQALAVAGANVVLHGPYDNASVLTLMRSVDAVLVPSTWWENAPVVIEEALLARRPVICADIGGMAEKVRPGLDGLHFRAGRARSLARVLQDVAERPAILAELAATLRRPWAADQALHAHLQLYAGLRSGAASPQPETWQVHP